MKIKYIIIIIYLIFKKYIIKNIIKITRTIPWKIRKSNLKLI